jgi:signal transduction histidine kinase/DNA-binding response OmpR family regulator
VALLLTASAVPLIITAVIEFRRSSDQIRSSAVERLEARAAELAGHLDDLHASILRSADQLAIAPAVWRYCESDAGVRAARTSELQRFIDALHSTDARLRGVSIFDVHGTIIATTEPPLKGKNYGFRRYFQEAVQGVHVISDIYISVPEVGSVPSIAYASPVRGHDGRIVGVAVFFARASALWSLVRAAHGAAGEGNFAVLFDRRGIRIAHSDKEKELFRPAGALPVEEIARMVEERRFGDATRELLENPSPMPEEFARSRGDAPHGVFVGFSPTQSAVSLGVTARLSTVPWTLFSLVPESTLYAPVRQLIRDTALANGLVIVLALAAGMIMAGRVLEPVRAISAAADAIRSGDLGARVAVQANDELGRLGDIFNSMASSLRKGRDELEATVRERTGELKEANQDLAARNQALAARQVRDLAYGRTLTALSRDGALSTIVEQALREAEPVLGSLILVCYQADHEALEPVASIGAIGQVGSVPVTGHVAEALQSRRTLVIDLPEDSQYRYEAALATAPARTAALVPLAVGERSVGLLAAGAAASVPPQALAFLTDLSVPLALTFARHELREKTLQYSRELAHQNETLRQQGAAMSIQAQELKEQQVELEAKNREIERANQLKSEFLANMSHELRTPLNAVIGFSEVLLEERSSLSETHAHFIDDILASGRHLLSLINSVLDLAKIEAGHVVLELEAVTPSEVVRTACTLVAPAAQKKRIHLVQEYGGSHTPLRADRRQLHQILLNLLSNAVKFSPEGSEVTIGIIDRPATVHFFVRDHGEGISQALMPNLFKPFVQGDNSLAKKHQGTGLGLAITRRIIEQHGGKIAVEKTPGGGATFWFELPVSGPVQEPVAQKPPAKAMEVIPPIEPLPRLRGPAPASPHVLVVEDDAPNARLLCSYLQADGYSVSVTTRASEALDIAGQRLPDAIILDLILPDGRDGLAVLEEFKRRDKTRSIPIIVVSVLAERERCLRLGAEDFFLKPITARPLLASLRRVLGRVPESAGKLAVQPSVNGTVLVVDDHELNRKLARQMLEGRGYRVLDASDGVEGIKLIRTELPKLVLMDLAMPHLDGFQAARELKADPATAFIPLVAFTALAMTGDAEKARNAGFDGYLAKPIEKTALEEILNRFLPGAPT